MDIAGPCDTEPKSALSIHELAIAQYAQRVLTALADLQLGKKGGWTNTEMEMLVCEYDAICGQRGLMRNIYAALKNHSGRSERSIRRLLSAIRSATGSDAARLVSAFFAPAGTWTDYIYLHTYTQLSSRRYTIVARVGV